MKYLVFILFVVVVVACHFVLAADTATPIFWERSFSINISNPDANGYLIPSTSSMVSSPDFQGLNVAADRLNIVKKIVFDFGDCCKSSNTTLATLEQLNFNSVKVPAIENAQRLALVKRGNCNWSEKVAVVNNLALLNNMNVTAIFIYDNETYQDVQVSTTLITGSGSASPSGSVSSLPASRNALNMTDNDLISFTTYPTIYFIPNAYGQTLIQHINTMYNSTTPYLRYYWLITPYFDEVTWGDTQSFFSTSKGYIAYIIILAVVFIIAFVFLRWWRLRNRRRAYLNGGFTDGAGFHMQTRTNQVDPLPVDIVNRLPIDKYSENLIKNVNCAICLEDFVPGKHDIRMLPCGHGFCVLCIDPWLTQKSTLCPICKWDCLPVDLRQLRNLQTEEGQQQHVDTNHQEPLPAQTENHHAAAPTHQPNITSPPSTTDISTQNEPPSHTTSHQKAKSVSEEGIETPENSTVPTSSSSSDHTVINLPTNNNQEH